jgi:ribosomal protein S18 acetylase RimI-like enzyme
MNRDEVLRAYDAQVRRDLTPPIPSWQVEDLGRIIRQTAPATSRTGAFIGWNDFTGLDDDAIDALIAEHVAYFAQLGRHSEWKHYDHDLPADLSDRLVAAGLQREEPEALVVGETAAVLAACRAAESGDGIRVRVASVPTDLPAIAHLHGLVWGEDSSWLADELEQEKTTRPDDIEIFLAEDEATGALMCSAWVRFQTGTDFAGLWGGTTHPDWRRRGAYRALVAVRAELAEARGYRYLQVDSAPDSQPILRRLGLTRLATTTPHVWKPAAAGS